MKIAILYICTGKYAGFWKDFYDSSEKYFLYEVPKHYYVFTDSMDIANTDTITTIYKDYQGFPKDSLFRFNYFLEIKEELEKYDYIFFFNANMLFISHVNTEILPSEEQGGLVALIHPGCFNKHPCFFPYERNSKSLAYIPLKKSVKYKYYMGSLNGGCSDEYLSLIKTCAKNIDNDYNNNFIAIFHDESHLNQYLYDKSILGLSPAYGYPEGWNLPFEPKIIIRDKITIDPFYRKQPIKLITRIIKKLNQGYKAITW